MIFFLHGADTYRSRQKLNEIKDKFRKERDPSGLNITVVDGARADMDAIIRAVSSAPFLAKRRMVVIENIFANKNEEALKDLVGFLQAGIGADSGTPSDTSCIKIFWDPIEEPPKKSSEAFNLWNILNKEKFNLNFDNLNGQALAYWIAEEFRQAEVGVTLEEVQLLVAMAGNDTWTLRQEIDKLAAYCNGLAVRTAKAATSPAGGIQPRLTSDIIRQMVRAQIDDNIFKLVDAVSLGQKGVALKLITDQIDNGANEIYLLSMINRAYRILTMVKMTPPEKQAGMGLHSFVLKKALSQAAKYKAEDLRKIYQKLVDLDEKIKTGFGSPVLLIVMLIATV